MFGVDWEFISAAIAILGALGWFCSFLFKLHADRNELQKDVEKLEKIVIKQSEQAISFSAGIHAQINDLVIRLSGGKSE